MMTTGMAMAGTKAATKAPGMMALGFWGGNGGIGDNGAGALVAAGEECVIRYDMPESGTRLPNALDACTSSSSPKLMVDVLVPRNGVAVGGGGCILI